MSAIIAELQLWPVIMGMGTGLLSTYHKRF
jgi:hypothetical protein